MSFTGSSSIQGIKSRIGSLVSFSTTVILAFIPIYFCFIRIQLWFSATPLLLSKVDHEFHRSPLDPWDKVSHGVACFVCDDCHSRDHSRFFLRSFCAMKGMKGEILLMRV